MAKSVSNPNDRAASALAHHRAGRLKEAEKDYRAALESSGPRAPLIHNLGVVLAADGRPTEALASFEQALAIEPGYAAAHYNRGAVLEKLGRVREEIGRAHV